MPIPLSLTRMTTCSPSRCAVSKILPPLSVYLAALVSRFRTICSTRVGVDVDRQRAPSRSTTLSVCLRSSMSGRADSIAWSRIEPRVHAMLSEPNLAARDAGDIEQVVDEPDELSHLPLDDVARPVAALLVGGQLEDGHGVVDGGERVAELVGQHGQELILAAVVLAEGLRPVAPARRGPPSSHTDGGGRGGRPGRCLPATESRPAAGPASCARPTPARGPPPWSDWGASGR